MLIKVRSTSRDPCFHLSSHSILSHICGNKCVRSPHLATENYGNSYGLSNMKTEHLVYGALLGEMGVPVRAGAEVAVSEAQVVKLGWHLVRK